MQAAKNKIWSSDASPEATFAALLGVVQNGKFKIFALNNEHHKILFTSGKSAMSWGREFVAEVTPTNGKATLNLVCGGVDGRPKALLDGWKNGKAADAVLEAVQSVLAGSTGAPVQQQASFFTLDDGSTIPWSGPDVPDAARL